MSLKDLLYQILDLSKNIENDGLDGIGSSEIDEIINQNYSTLWQ